MVHIVSAQLGTFGPPRATHALGWQHAAGTQSESCVHGSVETRTLPSPPPGGGSWGGGSWGGGSCGGGSSGSGLEAPQPHPTKKTPNTTIRTFIPCIQPRLTPSVQRATLRAR